MDSLCVPLPLSAYHIVSSHILRAPRVSTALQSSVRMPVAHVDFVLYFNIMTLQEGSMVNLFVFEPGHDCPY
jgi:hypothetical protein